MSKEKRDERTYAIIGAAMEVHHHLGCGFREPVYQEALTIELGLRQITAHREVELPIIYKGQVLHTTYRTDFVCYDEVIVEIKALGKLSGTEEAQILNYLKASSLETGLLLNFGTASLEYKRFIWSGDHPQISQIR